MSVFIAWATLCLLTTNGASGQRGQLLINNGIDTQVAEVPWHAGIYKLVKGKYDQQCGGTLISRKIIVTAAHCFWNENHSQPHNASDYKVALGKYHRDWYEVDPGMQQMDVAGVHVHQRYRGRKRKYEYDLAVVQLTQEARLSNMVKLAAVDWSNRFESRQLVEGSRGTVSGWGITEEGRSSDILRSVKLPYVDSITCYDLLSDDLQEMVTLDKFCAGFTGRSTSVCPGDSGSGLMFRDVTTEANYLRGVVSLAFKPAHFVGACYAQQVTGFSRLSDAATLSWIANFTLTNPSSEIEPRVGNTACSTYDNPDGALQAVQNNEFDHYVQCLNDNRTGALYNDASGESSVETDPYSNDNSGRSGVGTAPYTRDATRGSSVGTAPYYNDATRGSSVDTDPYNRGATWGSRVGTEPYNSDNTRGSSVDTAPYNRGATWGSSVGTAPYYGVESHRSTYNKGPSIFDTDPFFRDATSRPGIVSRRDSTSRARVDSALLLAAEWGNLQAFFTMLQAGADPGALNAAGNTAVDLALLKAAASGQLGAARHLVETYRADPNARHPHGNSPLLQAALAGKLDLVTYLIEQGAVTAYRYGQADRAVDIALLKAAEAGRLDVVKYLLENGGDSRYTGQDGVTAGYVALGRAAEQGRRDIAWLLTSPPYNVYPIVRFRDGTTIDTRSMGTTGYDRVFRNSTHYSRSYSYGHRYHAN